MAELFGVFSGAAGAGEALERFDRLAAAFAAAGTLRASRGPAAGVAVVSRHPHDPAGVAHEPARGFGLAWVGRSESAAEPEAALASALLRGAGTALVERPPPFAAAVWAAAPERGILASDPFGLQPLYYGFQRGLLVFASNFGTLLRAGGLDWRLDHRAVLDFFSYEQVTGDRSFADAVRVLPPGSLLRVAGGAPVVEPYVDPLAVPRGASAPAEFAARLHAALCRAVERATAGRSRVAVTLSGGLDSRALLGCAREVGADVRAFTLGVPGSRDLPLARALAERAGVPHQTLVIDGSWLPRHLAAGVDATGGMVSCAHFHIAALADRLAAEADVVLDGLGGDALTGAHLGWDLLAARSAEAAVRVLQRRRACVFATPAARRALFRPDFFDAEAFLAAGADSAPEDALRACFAAAEPPWRGGQRFDLRERQRRLVQFGPHQLRGRVDVQTPFYWPEPARIALGAGLRLLVGQAGYLRMHREHLPELARVRDAARGLPLAWPAWSREAKRALDALRRRLPGRRPAPEGPADYARWFRTDLRGFVEERLLGEGPRPQELFQRPTVERLVREHLSGAADHAPRLACLLTFDAWSRAV